MNKIKQNKKVNHLKIYLFYIYIKKNTKGGSRMILLLLTLDLEMTKTIDMSVLYYFSEISLSLLDLPFKTSLALIVWTEVICLESF